MKISEKIRWSIFLISRAPTRASTSNSVNLLYGCIYKLNLFVSASLYFSFYNCDCTIVSNGRIYINFEIHETKYKLRKYAGVWLEFFIFSANNLPNQSKNKGKVRLFQCYYPLNIFVKHWILKKQQQSTQMQRLSSIATASHILFWYANLY